MLRNRTIFVNVCINDVLVMICTSSKVFRICNIRRCDVHITRGMRDLFDTRPKTNSVKHPRLAPCAAQHLSIMMSDLFVCYSYVPLGYVSLISLIICLILFAMFDLRGCFVDDCAHFTIVLSDFVLRDSFFAV